MLITGNPRSPFAQPPNQRIAGRSERHQDQHSSPSKMVECWQVIWAISPPRFCLQLRVVIRCGMPTVDDDNVANVLNRSISQRACSPIPQARKPSRRSSSSRQHRSSSSSSSTASSSSPPLRQSVISLCSGRQRRQGVHEEWQHEWSPVAATGTGLRRWLVRCVCVCARPGPRASDSPVKRCSYWICTCSHRDYSGESAVSRDQQA